jgi:hypothetical protein
MFWETRTGATVGDHLHACGQRQLARGVGVGHWRPLMLRAAFGMNARAHS